MRPVILDSGCTATLTGDSSLIIPGSIHDIEPITCSLANGSSCSVRHACKIKLILSTACGSTRVVTLDAHFLPSVGETLICPVQLQRVTQWHKGSIRYIEAHDKFPAISLIDFQCGSRSQPDYVQCVAVVPPHSRRTQFLLPVISSTASLYLDSVTVDTQASYISACSLNSVPLAPFTFMDWHIILGHPHLSSLVSFLKCYVPEAVPSPQPTSLDCPTCDVCNHIPTSIPSRTQALSKQALQVLHVDLCFPVGMPSTAEKFGGIGVDRTTCALVVVDDFTRFYFVIPLASKSDAPAALLDLIQRLETRFSSQNYKVSSVISDNGTEFVNTNLKAGIPGRGLPGLVPRGITLAPTAPYTPAQNGVAERAGQSVVHYARRLLHHSKLPLNFWPFALTHAATLLNHLPRSRSSKSSDTFFSCDLLGVRRVPVASLLPFGSTVYFFPQDTASMTPKLSTTAVAHTFLGIPDINESISQIVVYRPSKTQVTTVSIAAVRTKPRDYSVSESISTAFTHCTTQSTFLSTPIPGSKYRYVSFSNLKRAHHMLTNEYVPFLPSSIGMRTVGSSPTIAPFPNSFKARAYSGSFYPLPHPMFDLGGCVSDEIDQTSSGSVFLKSILMSAYSANGVSIPNNPSDAFKDDNWRAAMKKEYGRLTELNTFETVQLTPQESKSVYQVGCRWVFNIKNSPSGLLYKARLVAQGYSQQHGVHYNDTFAPVMSKPEVRTLIALGCQLGYDIHQLDVTTAFLYGDIDVENLYIKPIPMFESNGPGFLRLKKALYGLKQSPKLWYEKLTSSLSTIGYKQSTTSQCVYTKNTKDGPIFLGLYVDDLLLVCPPSMMEECKKDIMSLPFDLKDLGKINQFLGMNFNWSEDKLVLSQSSYIGKALTELLPLWADKGLHSLWEYFGKSPTAFTPKTLPMSTSLISRYKTDPIPDTPNAARVSLMYKTVGIIRYLADSGRPDVGAAAMYLSTMMHNPREVDMLIALNTLCYLSGTRELGVPYPINKIPASTIDFQLYSDATWKSTVKCRSVSGHLSLLNGCLIDWRSVQQKNVSLSAAESEFQALTQGIQSTASICRLIKFLLTTSKTTKLGPILESFTDNSSVIASLEHENPHNTTLRDSTYFYWVKDFLIHHVNPKLTITWIDTKENPADVMTKALPKDSFTKHLTTYMNR